MKRLSICVLLLMFTLCFMSSWAYADQPNAETADSTYSIELNINCIPNLFFSRYNIAIYVDNSIISTLNHGEESSYLLNLVPGDHIIRFTKADDSSINGVANITVSESRAYRYNLSCSSTEVSVEEIRLLTVPIGSADAAGMNYSDVVNMLSNTGFDEFNIETVPVQDLTIEEADRAMSVESIEINNIRNFTETDTFFADASVKITYHKLMDINPPASSLELTQNSLNEIAKQLENAGFSNVELKRYVPYVSINGDKDFNTSEKYPVDAKIIVGYREATDAELASLPSSKPTLDSTSEDVSVLVNDNLPVLEASEYEAAYVYPLTEYSIYYLIDLDTQIVRNYTTNDTGILVGTFTGDLASGIDIYYDYDGGWHEQLKYKNAGDDSAVTVTDVNGFEYEYTKTDVAEAEAVLNLPGNHDVNPIEDTPSAAESSSLTDTADMSLPVEDIPQDELKEYQAKRAFEYYGEACFPYGFECHWFTQLYEHTQLTDGSWVFKVGVTITNEYGASYDATAEATINNTTESVEGFTVY